jgi:hypothetical protein
MDTTPVSLTPVIRRAERLASGDPESRLSVLCR